ncbi:BTAD domain-containing putative transcriptional regulator [Actinokineospora sp. NPDC004072]
MLGFLARLTRGLLAAVVLAVLLAGLPWALTHFIGWPLSDHLPSWAEIHGVLLGPMTTTFLLDFLACATWLVWGAFVLDVARCAIEIVRDARMADLAAAGPIRRIAAVLVGAVLISILGQRASLVPALLHTAGPGITQVVATASAWNQPAEQATAGFRTVAYSAPERSAPAVAAEQPARAKSAVVLPYDPRTGVYDSLWRMAERTLGDGNRWPEIFELNKSKPQPDGGTLIRPSLVFPGEEMALPDDATVPANPPRPTTPGPVTPSQTTTTPPPSSPTAPTPSTTSAPATTDVPGEPGFRWGEELFVGLGLASAVSAALAAARRRYVPGSGDRSDLPVAPVVYRLRLAHLRADHDALDSDVEVDDDLNFDRPSERPRRTPAPPVVLGTAEGSFDDQAPILPMGVHDGREIALNLASSHGLGLVGAGAAAAVRALLVTVLTTAPEAASGPARVVVAAEDRAVLLGRRAAQVPLPASVHVVADLDAALDVLESETLVRLGQHPATGQAWEPVVLVTRAPGRQSRRLQAVLDNGASVGVTGLLVGQWTPGVTAYVRDDGTISATSPGIGEPLRGTSVFRLSEDHTADLLALLRRADAQDGPGPVDLTGDDLPPGHPRHPLVVIGDPAPVEPTADAGDHARTKEDQHIVVEDPVDDTDLELVAADGAAERRGARDPVILVPASMTSPGRRLRPTQQAVRPRSAPTIGNDHRLGTTEVEPSMGECLQDRVDADGVTPLVPLRISVLGPPQVWWRPTREVLDAEAAEREVTSAFQPRLRELLVFLALHPDGASREALTAALWATRPREKTTNAMNTSLSRLRRALATATDGALADVVLVGERRYRLDPELVEVDYWTFAAAVAARRVATTDQQRVEAYRHIVDSYRGPLADGLSTEWIETAREAIRRDAIDAVAALARALVDQDPQQTLDLLEIARAFDPHNELIYRDIMRLQERLGQLDAIPRTLTLLATRLIEVDERPTPQTIGLAERLRRRHDVGDPSHPPGADRDHSKAG